MKGAQASTAVINAPSRRLFRPMFRARWQNMQNIVNDSAFIDMIPEPYLSYYIAYIEQCIQWSRGFVPMLHRSDFFSTGMGYTVCEIFTRECMAGGYRFESVNPQLKQFMEKWAEKDDFDADLSRMFWNTNAGGNSLLVLTPVNGDVYASAYPVNRCFFQIGRRGNVTQATLLNRFVAGEDAYYARETRLYLDGVPYYRVRLGKGTLVVSPTWNSAAEKDVPEKIAAQWAYAYGDIQPDVWYRLPLPSLGVYNVRNKPVAVALADMPGYSDSTLYTALDVLYSIDYNYTQAQVDMYMGKSRALVPKQMSAGTVNTRNEVAEGLSYTEAVSQVPLDDQFYTQIMANGIDGKPIQPTLMQPDLRGEAHKYIRDSDLELLASKVGLSSSTLANHLTYNNSKTATEVRSEQDTTEGSVNIKRKLANNGINAMLNDIAAFYGFNDPIEIAWGSAGVNSATENQELLADYQAGVLPLRKYLQKRWPDLSEGDVEQWAQDIEAEQERKAQQDSFGQYPFDDRNYFGDNSEVPDDAERRQSA